MSFFNLVFLSAHIKTTFKKANNFKNDDPTSLSDPLSIFNHTKSKKGELFIATLLHIILCRF